jgi:drug/metabolite transporter (DMT)-like permease
MRSVIQNEASGVAVCELADSRHEMPNQTIQPEAAQRGPFRAFRLLTLVLVLRPLGNVFLAWGMKHFPQVLSVNPLPYFRALMNPFVALGIAALVLGLLTRMALLSLADLSFVLPLTATGYVFSTLLGRFFLSEQVSWGGWAGTALIFLGTALVGTTAQRTPVREKPSSVSLDVTLP